MPGRSGAAAACQQPEPVIELCCDFFNGEDLDPRRGQLDRQRDAVEPGADLRHGGRVDRCQREPGAVRGRTVDEESDRLKLCQAVEGRQAVRIGHREGGHAIGGFPRNPQRFLAGGQHAQLRARLQQRLHQVGAPGQHMLAVVQHEQQRLGFEVVQQGLDQRPLLLTHAQRHCHRLRHERRI